MTLLMIIGAIILRLIPHLPNFAPITALALFGGSNLNKRTALFFPLASLVISDYLLLYINPFSSEVFNFNHLYPITALLHSTSLYVYGSFLISGLIGIWLKTHQKPIYILIASLLATLQFFLITNYGVWAEGMYSRGPDGLIQSYLMGLPFLKWTLLGDIFYTTMFFGTFKLAKRSSLSFEMNSVH